MRTRSALSLVELLVVLGIIAVISVPSFLAFSQIKAKQALAVSAEKFAVVLKRAHIYAREEKGGTPWGVRIKDERSYQLIYGRSGTWSTEAEQALDFPVRFVDSSWEVWFAQGSGSTVGGAEVRMATPTSLQAVISVSKNGVVEVR